ncbi:hypothetical protein N7494_012991 [Penicillium frequentans]|uniref:Uncharacterized protein n=1 Tax=Penicillium frequentans TaxID=3151616 RepID=A0AAD6GAK9_9EURO|nr:hypothetical protein N7494_012991 [Penicillium glabrum]
MCPDINSLPQSRSSSTSSSLPHRNPPTASPGTAPAPMNPNTTSPRPSRGSSAGRLSVSERRRSAAGMNLNLNESPSASGNHGESPWPDHRSSIGHAFRTASPTSHGGSPVFATADPHHQRAPSLGELHQELEQEQEAQVNRLLQMIRSQQAQLQQFQQQSTQPGASTAVVDELTPSERSSSFSLPIPPPVQAPSSRLSISSISNRRSSRPPSQTTSPNLQPQDASRGFEGTEAFPALPSSSRRGSRDENTYYQAEAAMLSRENQMLRQRIRELERQIGDLTVSARPSASPATESGGTSGQEGAETADPPAVRSADGKD